MTTLPIDRHRRFEGHAEGVFQGSGRDRDQSDLARAFPDKIAVGADADAARQVCVHDDVAALGEMDRLGFSKPRHDRPKQRPRAEFAQRFGRAGLGVVSSAKGFAGIEPGHRPDTIGGKQGAVVTTPSKGFVVYAVEVGAEAIFPIAISVGRKLHPIFSLTACRLPANDLARVDDVKSQNLENEESMKLQRKSLERLAELFGEAKDLIDGLVTEADEEKSEVDDQADDEEGAASDNDDAEAKYNAAVEAVKTLSFHF